MDLGSKSQYSPILTRVFIWLKRILVASLLALFRGDLVQVMITLRNACGPLLCDQRIKCKEQFHRNIFLSVGLESNQASQRQCFLLPLLGEREHGPALSKRISTLNNSMTFASFGWKRRQRLCGEPRGNQNCWFWELSSRSRRIDNKSSSYLFKDSSLIEFGFQHC